MKPEHLERLRSRIGEVRRPNPNRWNRIVSADAIRHWAWGIGDDNPLWLQPDYARTVGFDDVLSPPTFLYSFFYGPLGPTQEASKGTGLPGAHALHAGDDWRFFRQPRIGETIQTDVMLEQVNELPSSYAGVTIEQVILNRFFGPDGDPIAEYRLRRRSHARSDAKKANKWADIEPWTYSDDDVEAIAQTYAAESPRGTTPLNWNDLAVGQEIPTRQKGPLTSSSIVTYLACYGAYFNMTDRIAHNYMRTHPGAIAMDRQHNIRDMPERAHWDDVFVREIGFPMGYDVGTQRISWFGHLLTDWIGDRGRVLSLDVQLREPNWMWDLTTLHGKITTVGLENGEPTVCLDLWADSQRGRVHATGSATVVLGEVLFAANKQGV